MRRTRTIAAAALAGMLAAGPASAGHGTALGVWFTEGQKSKVEIYDCDGKLCGRIIWLKEPLDDKGKEKLDIHNPDQAQRGRKIVGLDLLHGFVASPYDEHEWEDGEIYDPENGKLYSCTLTLEDDGSLDVRGYIGIPLFGRTQVWTRGH